MYRLRNVIIIFIRTEKEGDKIKTRIGGGRGCWQRTREEEKSTDRKL